MGKFIDRLEEYLLIILFPIMTIIVFGATVVRYLKLGAIPWSEELARYIMIWMAYIGASLGIKRNAHLGIEAFVNKLPPTLTKYVKAFKVGIILLFNILVVYYSYQIIMCQINMGQTSPALEMPIWIAYLAVPTGAFLMCIRLIQTLLPQKKALSQSGAPSEKDKNKRRREVDL